MGSLIKKIQKKANRFQSAMKAVEKAFAEQAKEATSTSYEVPQKFDLKSIIEKDMVNINVQKRKERNKRKAKRRTL